MVKEIKYMSEIKLTPFRFWCQKVLPLVYDDSLSYYELLCKVVDYLNHMIVDVNQLGESFQQLQAYVNNYFSGLDVQTEIDNKLDAMAASGELEAIFAEYFGFYLTPEMYGAEGDGVTDDSEAFAAAIADAAIKNLPVLLQHDYFIDSDLTVPSYVRIFGVAGIESLPVVIAGSNVSTLFECTGIRNTFDGIVMKNYEDTYRNFDLIQFDGNTTNDIDSAVRNCTIAYGDSGVIIKGRNVTVENTTFSHCRLGVNLENVSGNQIRGLVIRNNSFHGIGEETALGWFENSACISAQLSMWSNLIIENNHAEQSGTFFRGYGSAVFINGNFVESWEKPIIDITMTNTAVPPNEGHIDICGNYFTGRRGEVAAGVVKEFPDYIVKLVNMYRVSVKDNFFNKAAVAAVYAETLVDGEIVNNTTGTAVSTGMILKNCARVNCEHNTAINRLATAIELIGDNTLKVSDNVNYATQIKDSTPYVSMTRLLYNETGTGTTGTAISGFSIPADYFITFPTAGAYFSGCRSGQTLTGNCYFNYTENTIYLLNFASDILRLYAMDLSDGTVAEVETAAFTVYSVERA